MNESTVNLLLQIPLAGVVVVVVILFLRYLEKMTNQMITFMQQQADTNREFLKTQREQTNEALGRLAEEQKTLAASLSQMVGVIAHVTAKFDVKRRAKSL